MIFFYSKIENITDGQTSWSFITKYFWCNTYFLTIIFFTATVFLLGANYELLTFSIANDIFQEKNINFFSYNEVSSAKIFLLEANYKLHTVSIAKDFYHGKNNLHL